MSKNPVVLKLAREAPNESKEILDKLAHMLRLARRNQLTGFVFVAFEPGDITRTLVSDGAVHNPLRALGAIRLLENLVIRTLKDDAEDEAASP